MFKKIYAYVGPMCSGKTGILDNLLHTQELAGMNVFLFRPSFDTRQQQNKFADRNGFSRYNGASHLVEDNQEIWTAYKQKKFEVVGFDEGQFFKPSLVPIIFELFSLHNVLVYYSGLDTDFLGRPFETTKNLIVLPEVKVYKQRAVCVFCHGTATRTLKHTVDGNIFTSDQNTSREQVGDLESYSPTCLSCFNIAIKAVNITIDELKNSKK